MSRVLLLTSRRDDGNAMKDLLIDVGHVVDLVDTVPRAVELVERLRPDVVIADLEPWTWGGRAVLESWAQMLRAPRLVLLCARRPEAAPPEGLRYLRKPVDFAELRAAIGASGDGRRRQEAA
jgi:DNA-binding response OmpR family regulator